MYLIPIGLFLLSITALRAQENTIPMMGFKEFEKYLSQQSDTVYVINFWATWCAPCRQELPEFEKIHRDYGHGKVSVLLVSLDFPAQAEKGLMTFLKTNHITASVVLLNEPDANAWINKIDPSWTGSLPATLVYRGSDKVFYEKVLTYPEISATIQSFTNL